MTTVPSALPAEVMEALQPAYAAVERQVRAAARATMQKRMERAGIAVIRILGYHRTHEEGFDNIMSAIFGVAAVVSARGEAGKERYGEYRDPDLVPGFVPARPVNAPVVDDDDEDDDEDEEERTCTCDECTDQTCQGDCERCRDRECGQCHGDHGEDYDCATCHDIRGCCGYCEICDEHHDDQTNDYDRARCADCDHCRTCDHYCD